MNHKQFHSRINVLIEAHKSAANLARLADVSEGVVRKWRDGKSDPSRQNLLALAKGANVNLIWLATGDGPMQGAQETCASLTDKEEVLVLDVEVSTGHGAHNGQAEAENGTLAFQRQYLAGRGLKAKELRVVFAKGDSMEPEIQDGAAMLVNTSDTRLDEGCIYIVRRDDHLFAKRIRRSIDGGITLISANKEYPPMVVSQASLNELQVIGRVVWSGREH